MYLEQPIFLWGMVLLPLYWGIWWSKHTTQPAIQMTILPVVEKISRSKRWLILPYLQVVMASITIGLMLVAMARPQTVFVKEEVTKKGIDIVLALDVSGSMMAEDLQPNRMEAAKKSIGKFIDNRENDRMAVVVFAGKAFTQSPLTFDYEILKEYLTQTTTETIDQQVRGLSGTAVGDAILAGIRRFDREDAKRNKVLILATDGDANVGAEPSLAAQKAASEGVKIYTIGIGSEEGALIPVMNSSGQKTYMTDELGQPVKAVFNEASLKELSEIGNGAYFRADDNASFDRVLKEINDLEKSEVTVSQTSEYTDAHQPWLWAAGLCFCLWVVLLASKPILR